MVISHVLMVFSSFQETSSHCEKKICIISLTLIDEMCPGVSYLSHVSLARVLRSLARSLAIVGWALAVCLRTPSTTTTTTTTTMGG
jgi:hypothetical protein